MYVRVIMKAAFTKFVANPDGDKSPSKFFVAVRTTLAIKEHDAGSAPMID